MKNALALAAVLTVSVVADAPAQPLGACEPRVSIGAAVGFLNGDLSVDPVFAAGHRFALASTRGTGVDVSAGAAIPFHDDLTVRAEFGTATMRVAVEREASGEYIRPRDAGELRISRAIVGLQRTHAGRFTCFYATVGAGVYRFSYRGVATNGPGGIAALGLDVPAGGARAVFFELGLEVALPKARPPMTPTGVAAEIRPALGVRFRF